MAVEVQGPGGAVVTFPDGVDAATVHDVMSKAFGGSSAPRDKSGGITAGNLMNAALDVPVLGPLARKADAALRATSAVNNSGLVEKLPEETYGERYSHALENLERPLKDFAEEHPIASIAAGAVGLGGATTGALKAAERIGARLAMPAIPAATEAVLGLGGRSLGQQVARSAASGAGINAADALARGNDPVEALLAGAGIGAVAPVAARQVGKLWSRAAGLNPEMDAELAKAAEGIHGNLGESSTVAAGGTSRFGTAGRPNVTSPEQAAATITGAMPAFKAEADANFAGLPGRFHAATFNNIKDALDVGLAAGGTPVTLSHVATPVTRQAYRDLIDTLGPTPPGATRGPITPTNIADARDYLVSRMGAATDPRDQRAMAKLIEAFDSHIMGRIQAGTYVGHPTADVADAFRRKLFAAPHAADAASRAIAGLGVPGVTPEAIAETLYGAGSTPVRIAQRLKEMFGADSPEFAAVKQGLFANTLDAAHPAAQAGGVDSLLKGPGRAISQIYLRPEERAAIEAHGEALRSAAAQRPAVMPTAEDLKSAASDAYDHPAIRGLEIKPTAVADKATLIAAELRADGFHPKDQPKTFSALKDLTTMPGRTVSAADVDMVRKRLNKAGGDFSNPPEQEASRRAISAIDRWLAGGLRDEDIVAGNLGEASKVLNEARANYAAGSRMERLKDAEYRADLHAAGAHSGTNVNNAMRQQIRSILLNPSRRRGFSDAETAAMESVVRGTATGNALRTVSRLLAHHGLGGLGVAAAGYGATHSIFGALAAPAIGAAAHKLSDASTARGIREVERLIALRSPLGARAAAAPPGPVRGAMRNIDPETLRRAVIMAVRSAALSAAH